MILPIQPRGVLQVERSRLSISRLDPERFTATLDALEIRPAKLPETIIVIDGDAPRQGFTFREAEHTRDGDLVFAEYRAKVGPFRMRLYA